jgi:ABC-type Fe3+-siderophore transport system permease subunit
MRLLLMRSNPYESRTIAFAHAPPLAAKNPFPFLSAGPLTGAIVGLAHATASAVAWNWYGQPDFLFRSGATVLAVAVMLAVGGATFGLAYGCVLMLFTRLSKRNVQPTVHIVAACVTSFILGFAAAVYAFERHSIISPFLVAFSTAAIAFLVATLSSVPYADSSVAEDGG